MREREKSETRDFPSYSKRNIREGEEKKEWGGKKMPPPAFKRDKRAFL